MHQVTLRPGRPPVSFLPRALTAVMLALALTSPLASQSLPRAAKPEDVGLSSDRLHRITAVFND